jgi:ketosteroid isomerase-like protein
MVDPAPAAVPGAIPVPVAVRYELTAAMEAFSHARFLHGELVGGIQEKRSESRNPSPSREILGGRCRRSPFRSLGGPSMRTFTEGTRDLYDVLDPHVEWTPVTALLEGTTYRGEAGVRRWMAEMKSDWMAYELKPQEFRDVGGSRVLVLGAWRAQGRRGKVPLDFPQAAWLLQVRGQRVTWVQAFTDHRKALEAAGLSE